MPKMMTRTRWRKVSAMRQRVLVIILGIVGELSVRPTLRIRAGGSVRLLVTRDIQLRPYREDRSR